MQAGLSWAVRAKLARQAHCSGGCDHSNGVNSTEPRFWSTAITQTYPKTSRRQGINIPLPLPFSLFVNRWHTDFRKALHTVSRATRCWSVFILERHPTTSPPHSATTTQDTLNSSRAMYLCHWRNTEMHSPSLSHPPPLTTKALSLCPMSFRQFPPVTDKFGSGFQALNNLDTYKEVRGLKGILGVSWFCF